MSAFEKWLDTYPRVRPYTFWTQSDVRAGFEAGRVEGLEEAAALCDSLHLGNSPGPLMDGGFNFAKECAVRNIRALASTPPGEPETLEEEARRKIAASPMLSRVANCVHTFEDLKCTGCGLELTGYAPPGEVEAKHGK